MHYLICFGWISFVNYTTSYCIFNEENVSSKLARLLYLKYIKVTLEILSTTLIYDHNRIIECIESINAFKLKIIQYCPIHPSEHYRPRLNFFYSKLMRCCTCVNYKR